jgi:hypothetical protein
MTRLTQSEKASENGDWLRVEFGRTIGRATR